MSAQPNLSIEDYEKLLPVTALTVEGVRLRFFTPNARLVWRARTLLSKEPSTIAWLETIEPGEVLLDVGANMGGYSVYAAAMRRARVHAVEPEGQNFAILARNVLLNELQDRVTCWPMALSDTRRFDRLFISDPTPGGSCHSFGAEVDFRLQPARFALSQGCVAATIDELVTSGAMPLPGHIKIDVDGFEHLVVAGARGILGDQRLRSLNIETNKALPPHRAMVETLESFGFATDPAQIARATRASGPFAGVAEHVFRR
jgi:FkbM family methyltransferase